MAGPVKKLKRILLWRGLMGDERLVTRMATFAFLAIVAISMTFLQLGFAHIEVAKLFFCYLFGLLIPISAASLTLGVIDCTLVGLISGIVLYVHARLQPHNLVESFFVTPLSSIVLNGVVGLLLSVSLAFVLRNEPRGCRRYAYMLLVSAVLSCAITYISYVDISIKAQMIAQPELFNELFDLKTLALQAVFDAIFIFAPCVVIDRSLKWYNDRRNYLSVRTIMRIRLFAALVAVFTVVSSASYCFITVTEVRETYEDFDEGLNFLADQVSERNDMYHDIVSDAGDDEDEREMVNSLAMNLSYSNLIESYRSHNAYVALFTKQGKAYANNADFLKQFQDENTNATAEERTAFLNEFFGHLDHSAKSNEMLHVILSLNDSFALGYMRARQIDDDAYIMFAREDGNVFEHRSEAMFWITLNVIALLVVVYVIIAYLLDRNVLAPVDRTNEKLGMITGGDLDVMVCEVDSVEFASLSAGINTTVDSLKRHIDEAERRNARDLATGRSIQMGVLPRAFPAFPSIGDVDLYASMDPAKEVGGDFYDFFEVDDKTVCFLIADVSGKGIPGALFMMAAKAELQNYLSQGMEPAEAMAAANRYLRAHNEANMFVTVWAATLDWTCGELTFVNAGHNPPLLRHGRGGQWEWIRTISGFFVGFFDGVTYTQETLTLEPGDELVLYTDGVNEAFSVGMEEYGNDRLEAFLANHSDMPPAEIVPALRKDVATWAEGAEQSDDVTILSVEYRAGR